MCAVLVLGKFPVMFFLCMCVYHMHLFVFEMHAMSPPAPHGTPLPALREVGLVFLVRLRLGSV